MPTYVYECGKCGHRFEILQSITDPPRRRCPKCRGAVKRVLMPGGGLIFKGSGFYITDYRNKETKAKENRAKETKARETKARETKARETKAGERREGKSSGDTTEKKD